MPTETQKNILSALQDANGYVALGVTLAGQLVPLGKWAYQKLEAIGAGGKTVTFLQLVQTDTAELEEIAKMSADDIAAINVELAKLGVAPLALPATGVDPAPGITQ
jgi:hypothetical protein